VNSEQLITNNSQPITNNKNPLHLERYIRFLKERRPDRRIVYHGICFHLNEEVLKQIQQARSQGQSLFVKPKFLADLRYYLLFDEYSGLNCGINVSTYYLEDDLEETVLRSLISLDGDILYQINRHYLEQPELAIALSSAHYWLIEQLLEKLKLEGKLWLNLLSLGLSLLSTPYLWEIFKPSGLDLKLILMSLTYLVIQQISRYLLKIILSSLWRFLLKQLLTGELSRNYRLKQFVLGILRRLRL
jgi:hypothetical protein